MTKLDWSDDGQEREDKVDSSSASRIISFPDYIDASFMMGFRPICGSDDASVLDSGTQGPENLDLLSVGENAHLATIPCDFLTVCGDPYAYTMADLNWMGVDGHEADNFM